MFKLLIIASEQNKRAVNIRTEHLRHSNPLEYMSLSESIRQPIRETRCHNKNVEKANYVEIISLSLPEELLKELDNILGKEHSATRSEVIRQAVRNYISEYNELDKIKGNVIATITVLYEKTEKNEELFQVQHEFGDMITAYLHSHLAEANCLEVLVVKGSAQRLKNLIDGLKANKPVKQIKFSVMTTDEKTLLAESDISNCARTTNRAMRLQTFLLASFSV